jgi:chromate transporter
MSVSLPASRGSIGSLVSYFLRLGTVEFGGPVALCGQMERDLVQEKRWLTKEEMRDAIAVSQSLPGPLAIQVGIFISYMRGGFWGAWAGGWAFILPNFLIVCALGALYVHFGGLTWMTAIFYGVSPAVIALILHSCWRLGKLGMEDRFQWVVAAVALVVTVAVQSEVAILFIGAGILGVLWYGTLFRRGAAPLAALAPPVAVGAVPQAASLPVLGKLGVFFLKAGSLTFGSGLVIVPFLEKGLVQETGWLNPREFLVAVAVGMLSLDPWSLPLLSSATSSPASGDRWSPRSGFSCRRSSSFWWWRQSLSGIAGTRTCRASSRAPTPRPSARSWEHHSYSARSRSAIG